MADAAQPHPFSIRDEGPFLDELHDLAALGELRHALLAAGHTPPVANGLCSWLVAKRTGQPDDTAATTRSRYRRILRGLVDSGGPIGPARRRRRLAAEFPILARVRARIDDRAEAGAADVAALAGAVLAAVFVAAGHAWAAPIILVT